MNKRNLLSSTLATGILSAVLTSTLSLTATPAAAGCGVSECNSSTNDGRCCRQQMRCEIWNVQPCSGGKTDYEFVGNAQLKSCENNVCVEAVPIDPIDP